MNMEEIYSSKGVGEQSFFAPTGMAKTNKPAVKSDNNVYDFACIGNIAEPGKVEYTRRDAHKA